VGIPAKDRVLIAQRALERLTSQYVIREDDYVTLHVSKKGERDSFRTLVATILSQSSTDKGALQAYDRLNQRVGVEPRSLANAPLKSIAAAIKIGGLHRTKSVALKDLARTVIDRFDGNLDSHLSGLDPAKIRDILMSLPKVGPKTADVVIMTQSLGFSLPVDTHIDRIAKRLGFVSLKARYEEVRAALEGLFLEKDYHRIHLLLIAHGRQACKARKPRCWDCLISDLCPYPKKTEQE